MKDNTKNITIGRVTGCASAAFTLLRITNQNQSFNCNGLFVVIETTAKKSRKLSL